MHEHLNDDQLIDRLYGLSDDAHLEHCGDCSRRWREVRSQRARLAVPPDVSSAFLAAGRRKIYARLGERPGASPKWLPWAPALAAACLLVIGMFVYRPAPPQHMDTADAQLFADVYAMEQSTEPRAGAPINALFEDNQ